LEYLALFSAIAFVLFVLLAGRRILNDQYKEDNNPQNGK